MSNLKVTKIKHLSFNKNSNLDNIIEDEVIDTKLISDTNEVSVTTNTGEDKVKAVEIINDDFDSSTVDLKATPIILEPEDKNSNNLLAHELMNTVKASNEKDDKKDNDSLVQDSIYNNPNNTNSTKYNFTTSDMESSKKDSPMIAPISVNQRVFQKSIIFIIIDLLAFLFLTIISLNLFNLNLGQGLASLINSDQIAVLNIVSSFVISFIFIGVSTAFTNVLFIIIPERNYLFISLLLKTMIVLGVHATIGMGFTLFTGLIILLYILNTYLGYSELEKNQLSSRIFNISHITTECTRILSLAGLSLIALGLFNQIIAYSTPNNGVFNDAESFISKVLFADNSLVDNVLIGVKSGGNSNGVNNVFFNKAFTFQNNRLINRNNQNPVTLGNFLELSRPELVLSEDEELVLKNKCTKEKVSNCSELIKQKNEARINEWKNENYPTLKDTTIQTTIDLPIYRTITKQYYLSSIKDISKDGATESARSNIPGFVSFLNFPPKYIIPAIFTFIYVIILFILRPIIHWLTGIITWIVWTILKLIGFTKIDIETVEAEVVSI
jgi:hypothetical protein